MKIKDPIFEYGQTVYNVVTGEPGIVIDYRYFWRANILQYLVGYGMGQECWCDEVEISIDKPVL